VKIIQIPEISLKNANKKQKTLLIYLAFLKSFTNSDRIKFNNLNELKQLTGISKGQLSKVINVLIQNKYIEYFFHNKENLFHLKFTSWQNKIFKN
jgi:DNA-binding MarR family transcriptional regulator